MIFQLTWKYRPVTTLWRKMSTSILTPPAAVRGMKELDKSLFVKDIQVPCLYIPADSFRIPDVRYTIKQYLMRIKRFISTVQDSEEEKRLVLNPDTVQEWDSLEAKHRTFLESKGISRESLRKESVTLNYDSWGAHEIISAILGDSAPSVSGFSRVGHIIHLNLRDEHEPYKRLIGAILLEKTPNARSVINKSSNIESEFRNINYELLAGESDLVAVSKENGCTFHVDYAHVYWNPRLSSEHERLVKDLQPDTILYDIFAGIGPFAIPAGKKGCTVLANDLNPASYQWLQKNIAVNNVSHNVVPYNMDAREFIKTVVKEDMLKRYANDPGADLRFAMNLPACADEFLNEFNGLLHGHEFQEHVHRPPTVCLYCFEKDTDPLTPAGRVRRNLGYSLDESKISQRIVRQVAPNKFMLMLQFRVPFEVLMRPPGLVHLLMDNAVEESGTSEQNAHESDHVGTKRRRLHS
ncbi:tRNA (guanine(37)-N1)-methyltransferase-like [Paramacrobiotus metropolitanus]|uniref:tRNA (guanine(37)-N1)-methyltransferase-like n=1 Tax=Paramacrobiotus metropolitanus TaxID=2943436 RepID=UPI00244604F3|nr:tRNA (guanine(37)-N1)-methyltransferase-like [Paramacrobiotus metropolitanus]